MDRSHMAYDKCPKCKATFLTPEKHSRASEYKNQPLQNTLALAFEMTRLEAAAFIAEAREEISR